MIVMKKDSVISINNAVIGMNGPLVQQQFVLSALSALNPIPSEELDAKLQKAREQVIAIEYPDVAPEHLELMSDVLWVQAIAYHYTANMDECRFSFAYADYVKFWEGEDANVLGSYTKLSKAAQTVVKTTMTRKYEVYTASGRKRKDTEAFSLVSNVRIKGTSEVVVQINPSFMPYLIKLTEVFAELGYTRLPVAMLRCRKTVSELGLMQFIIKKFNSNKGSKQDISISVEDFRAECGIKGYENNFRDFNFKWLKPAVKAINKHKVEGERVSVELTTQKKGRNVVGLNFHVESQDLLDFKNKKKSGNPEIQKKHNVNGAKDTLKGKRRPKPKKPVGTPKHLAEPELMDLSELVSDAPVRTSEPKAVGDVGIFKELSTSLKQGAEMAKKPKPEPKQHTKKTFEECLEMCAKRMPDKSDSEIHEIAKLTFETQR